MYKSKLIFSILVLLMSSSLQAEAGKSAMDNDIQLMQHEWAQIKYKEKNEDAQEKKIAASASSIYSRVTTVFGLGFF